MADHLALLDEEIGSLLESLTDETTVLVVSAHGAVRREGCFCINEWLVREGLLVLDREPGAPTPLARLDVDWDRTKVWAEGAPCARLYLNVRGREARGAIDPGDAGSVRDEVRSRLKGLTDAEGRPLQALVFRPEEIYREARGVAPDLIAQLGGMAWSTVDAVGHGAIHIGGSDGSLGGFNPSPHGAFILAGSNLSLHGELQGIHLLDLAPTLLQIGGCEIPEGMKGRRLAEGGFGEVEWTPSGSLDEEELIRERLQGLGYIA
jgi:predicted AlkP superfamily phosphohydrolase/phosphomutase